MHTETFQNTQHPNTPSEMRYYPVNDVGKEKSPTNLKFLRYRRYADRESAKKIRQIEQLLMNRQISCDIMPILISGILRPKRTMSAIATCLEM